MDDFVKERTENASFHNGDDSVYEGLTGSLLLRFFGAKQNNFTALQQRAPYESDWEDILEIAERQNLAPLLFFYTRKHSLPSPIPEPIEYRLKLSYLRCMAKGMYLYPELSGILSHFNNSQIPVIVLKGPHLAELVYRDRALRPMSDIDLLVRKRDLKRACDELYDLGYETSRQFSIEAETKLHPDLPAFHRGGKCIVELHWNLEMPTSPFRIDLEGVWERAQHVRIAEVDTLVLSNEDLLLHLCIHASYHHRFTFGLLPLVDIAETIMCHRERINWLKLQMLSEEWGVGRCVYLTLYLAHELLKADVPRQFLRALEPADFTSDLVETALQAIMRPSESSLPMTSNLSRLWGGDAFWRKVTVFLKSAFPSPEVLSTMCPVSSSSKRIYLYYPVRLKELLMRYGKTVVSLLKSDEAATAHRNRIEKGNELVNWLTSG